MHGQPCILCHRFTVSPGDLSPAEAAALLDRWRAWAQRCRIAGFVPLARTVRGGRDAIFAAIRPGITNARVGLTVWTTVCSHHPSWSRVRASYGQPYLPLIRSSRLRHEAAPISLPMVHSAVTRQRVDEPLEPGVRALVA